MTRQSLSLLFVPVTVLALLAGCSSTTMQPSLSASGVPVSLSMTDDPPAGVSVLFFQVSLTGAALMPASGSAVSLLNNNMPIQIDVTQLQALSAFLSTANVPQGTYNSVSLTFANPELVIYNASDSSIASSCAVGSVCQIAPAIDNSGTVSITTSPFPVTVTANSSLGFLVDFHLNNVIQSDLSVNLGVSNGVTVAQLPPAPTPPQFGALSGTVQSVNAGQNQFTLQTAWGRTFTIDSTTSTTYEDFPTNSCSTAGIGCLADGQVVQVQVASVGSGGVLTAAQVSYLQVATQQTAEGTIIGLQNSSSGTTIKLILHDNPSNSVSLPLGGVATVTVANNATYSVGANGFTLPSGLSFTGVADLYKGQQIQVDVVAGSLSASNDDEFSGNWGPPQPLSFTTDSVTLEPSQVSGTISALDSSAQSFTLGGNGGPFFIPWPMTMMMSSNAASFNVVTTTQTTYRRFSMDSYDGLGTGDYVSVSGWLFPPASSSGPPTLAAQTVVMRNNGMN
ncbi:MAG: DUF4382 domain-containing protein [Acidobacteriaceae bacterium]